MKIALFRIEDWEKKQAEDRLKDHELLFFEDHLTEEHMDKIKDVEVLGVFVWSKLTKEVMERLPKLKLIATRSTGFDHIDLNYCKEKGIAVCNVPTYGANTVAEHAFMLILGLSRKLYQSIKRTHEEQLFETDKSLRGFDLKGKTLGVLGCGNIGKHAARMGVGFEMKVITFDLYKDEKLAKKIGYKYVDMDTLLKESDVISIHVPYNKHTHHLINKETIGKMKDGVYIVNTARGGVIDTTALIEALKSGKIGGAGLDVLEGECEIKDEAEVLHSEYKDTCDLKTLLQDHMLMRMDNVIVTPHNAFNSNEALQRIMDTTIENVIKFIEGKPQNVVQ